MYYFVNGLYTDTLQTVSGCDSIVNTTLFVDPTFQSIDTVNICAGDSIQIGNNYYSSSGTFTDSLSSYTGCDSIISTLVIVEQFQAFWFHDNLCGR